MDKDGIITIIKNMVDIDLMQNMKTKETANVIKLNMIRRCGMTDFQMIVLVIMGFCTGSVALNTYFAYIINKIERENEELIKKRKNIEKWIENN